MAENPNFLQREEWLSESSEWFRTRAESSSSSEEELFPRTKRLEGKKEVTSVHRL
jgi:hypothetical protein